MKTPDFLAELDVRAIVRILADTASISDPAEQRRFVMQSLSTLVDADTWVWGVSPLLEPGQQPVYLYQHTHGLDDARMSRFLRAVEHPDTGAMTAPLAVAMLQAGSRVTRDRSRIVAPERFAISPARPFWEAADIGPLLISIGPVPGVGTSVAGFYRHVGAPEFTLRETRIMHIVLTELPWLHSAGLPHAAAAPAVLLSPRQRLVINHLVQGQSRQSTATHLG
ncbi:MAG: hypothetical protein KDN05_24295, partial [Verrucomicrobiae bacterium]|nr:hypothetical protein [Verrucomicrobiae bacterium]